MLVTLANNTALSAGASTVAPYACKSLQKVFIKIDDSAGQTAYDHTVTITLGQRVICQSSGPGLLGMSLAFQSGSVPSGTETSYGINLGSHELLDNENVYVTVRAGINALDAVDISAEVDSPCESFPIRYTEYADKTFTADGVLSAICYKSNLSAIDEDGTNVEMRNHVNSSSPTVISAQNWFRAISPSNNESLWGVLQQNNIPLNTSFNYAQGTANRILVGSLMSQNRRQVRQAQADKSVAQNFAQVSR
tara:strand:+ start:2323 stop:3072 length:750 start_codon:yes stop_codon:yes gene_type:complete